MRMNFGNYGLLLRAYVKKTGDVDAIVDRTIANIKLVLDLNIFNDIMILVPTDYDCGLTVIKLRQALSENKLNSDNLHIAGRAGHHSCEALNLAIAELHHVDKVVIISGKAIPYITHKTMEEADLAFSAGAIVVGVVVDELEEIILSGHVQNTFAIWDLSALLSLGGFQTDLGVEEIDPLVRLTQEHGQCIAILDPSEKPKLNIRKSADGVERHKEVMETKLARQQQEVDRLGVDLKFIRSGILPGYPKKI